MKTYIRGFLIIAITVTVLLSGCGVVKVPLAPATSLKPEPAETASPTTIPDPDEEPTPDATPKVVTEMPAPTEKPGKTQQPEVYIIRGSALYKQSEEGDTLIYEAAAYFEKGWDCWLGHLLVEDGILYFTEGGMLGDGSNEEDSLYRVIRVDGNGRTVLQEDNVIGYAQLVLYGSRIFILRDGFDSQDILWAFKDGASTQHLDFTKYAAQYGVEPYYNGATLYLKDGVLYADIAFYTLSDPEIVDHTVSISEDLKITRIS